MFIHLGGEKIIRSGELIAIFDLSVERNSKVSKQSVQQAKKKQLIEVIGEEESKSLVVTKDKVYYSPVSTSTLKKRAHHFVAT